MHIKRNRIVYKKGIIIESTNKMLQEVDKEDFTWGKSAFETH